MDILFYPPVAFIINLLLVGALALGGRVLTGQHKTSFLKTSAYSSGEAAPEKRAAPGYRQFFTAALFFAVLHLGVLMAGSGGLTLTNGIYVVGLILVLRALILG